MFIVLLLFALLESAPLWIPIAFVAYAVGRRQFSISWLFVFIAAEALGLAITISMLRTFIE
jgi:hypothetical protein